MVGAPQFRSFDELETSTWLTEIKQKFVDDVWPDECVRCTEIEKQGNESIRQYALKLHLQETADDYLQVGGVLDNICNAGCLSCNENLSTRIGSLKSKTFPIVNNSVKFWQLPQHRIKHLDINGGEPSYSKNYKKILANLPPNLKSLRLNTNCSTVLHELESISAQGIEVTVTVSCDGIGPVHELVRWPITWETFYKNLMTYKKMPVKLNLWTTVSVLNVDDLANIIEFAKQHEIDHSYAYLKEPPPLSVGHLDSAETELYIKEQKMLRDIS